MLSKLIEFAANHYVLSTLFIALLVAIIITELRRGARSLSNREATELLNSDQGQVLDVRAKKDFATGRIVNAWNLPYEKLASHMSELEQFRGKTLIVVDAAGQHAGSACQQLAKAGFTVAKLSGGMSNWRSDNLPVVK